MSAGAFPTDIRTTVGLFKKRRIQDSSRTSKTRGGTGTALALLRSNHRGSFGNKDQCAGREGGAKSRGEKGERKWTGGFSGGTRSDGNLWASWSRRVGAKQATPITESYEIRH